MGGLRAKDFISVGKQVASILLDLIISKHSCFRRVLRHQLTLGPSEEAGFLGLAAMGPWGQGVSASSIQATVGVNGKPEEGTEHHSIYLQKSGEMPRSQQPPTTLVEDFLHFQGCF